MISRTLAMIATLALFLAGMSPAQAQRLRAASGGLSIIHSLLWVTYEQKLLKKYGFDLEYIAIENGTVGMQALLANEAQFLFSTSSLAVNANLRGSDVTVVAGGLNFIPDKLIVRPEIAKLMTSPASAWRSAASALRRRPAPSSPWRKSASNRRAYR